MNDYLDAYKKEFERIKKSGGCKTYLADLLRLVQEKIDNAAMTVEQKQAFQALKIQITMEIHSTDENSFLGGGTV